VHPPDLLVRVAGNFVEGTIPLLEAARLVVDEKQIVDRIQEVRGVFAVLFELPFAFFALGDVLDEAPDRALVIGERPPPESGSSVRCLPP
jgi:hypothetical protein